MSPENTTSQPEESSAGEWRKILGVLSKAAQDRLGGYGRKSAKTSIDKMLKFYDNSVLLRVESPNIYSHFTVTMSVPKEKQGTKYISGEWAFGEDLPLSQIEFTVSKLGVTAYAQLYGAGEAIRMELLKTGQAGLEAAINLENMAKMTIDMGKEFSIIY